MAAPVYTPVNTMITRVYNTLKSLNIFVSDQTNEPLLFINQAQEEIQFKHRILRSSFIYTLTNDSDITIDQDSPYPFDVYEVWYGDPEVQLSQVSHAAIHAAISAGNTLVSKFAFLREGSSLVIHLNATPTENSLRIVGPFMPVYLVAGNTLSFKQRFDNLIEAIAVRQGVYRYTEDIVKRGFANDAVTLAEGVTFAGY